MGWWNSLYLGPILTRSGVVLSSSFNVDDFLSSKIKIRSTYSVISKNLSLCVKKKKKQKMPEFMKSKTVQTTLAVADALSFYCAITIVALMLTGAFRDDQNFSYSLSTTAGGGGNRLPVLNRRPCDEIYVVGEGETLHTISNKCGDPFIVEKNPHIHDPDDVFPGLVIKITPSSSSSSSGS